MNDTQRRAAPQRGRNRAPRRKRGRQRLLAFCIILLALALFAGFCLFLRGVFRGEWPSAVSPAVSEPLTAVLDDAWTAKLAACTTQQQMKNAIDAALDSASALHCTAVAWTARAADGTAFFRDGTKTLPAAGALTAGDRFFSRFDAVQYLVRRADSAGLQVLLLATDDSGSLLSADALADLPAWETALAKKHGLTVIAAQAGDDGAAAGTTLISYAASDGGAGLLRADADPALLASAKQTEGDALHGVILGDLTALQQDGSSAALYLRYVSGGALPDLTQYWDGKALSQTLAVTYPTADNTTVNDSSLFLMGTSDPAADLTLNGAAVARYGTQGVWGVLVTLSEGANAFSLQNGGTALTYTVQYEKPAAVKVTPAADGTPGTEAVGKKVRITDAIASALSDYGDSSSIRETLYQGATAEITKVVTYTSGAKITHAYQLATGDYIRAASCEVADAADAAFTGCTVNTDEASRSTQLLFTGGTPAVYHSWEGSTLTLTFLSASYTGTAPAADGAFLTGSTVENGDGRFTLTLTFSADEPLYGWAVNYNAADNTTSIWLKRAPHLSADAAAPLAGVTVLLDPGHGGSADGAMGSGGTAAPEEKELNLSAAYAAKYRLEQLGATVLLTREGDTNPSLGDRVTEMNTLHPDFFISIHHNSVELTADVNQSTGTEAYWFYSSGEAFAGNLVDSVASAAGRKARGTDYGYYYVTRSNICPATLLELGFVTNPAEYEACADPDTLWAEGSAIATAVYRTVAANG